MKKLLFLIICLLAADGVFAWGQKGHDVTAYIAECHLTPQATEKIDKVLNGHSMVYYANWLDVASRTPEYIYSLTWHYLNIDKDETYESMPKEPNGDVLTAVTMLVENLRKGNLTPDEEALSLKMLVHLVADLHCPMHVGRHSDFGGNQVPVTVFGEPNNLHTAWDTNIPETAHRWGYSEWQIQIDRLSDDEIVLIQTGEPLDWIQETHELCKQIYDETPEGTNISYDYVDKYTPVVEMQFLKGGYRLARLLNDIYSYF